MATIAISDLRPLVMILFLTPKREQICLREELGVIGGLRSPVSTLFTTTSRVFACQWVYLL